MLRFIDMRGMSRFIDIRGMSRFIDIRGMLRFIDIRGMLHNVVSSTPHHERDSNSQRYISIQIKVKFQLEERVQNLTILREKATPEKREIIGQHALCQFYKQMNSTGVNNNKTFYF
jgi:hypothetical protein